MTCRKPHFPQSLWALGLVLGLLALSLVGWRAGAHDGTARGELSRWGQAEQPARRPAAEVAAILNPDGTLRTNSNGSYDVRGYRMEYTANGAPRFVPAGAAQEGCSGWDTQFALPNGTNEVVRSLAVMGSAIYVGGNFAVAGNVLANRVAKFDTTTNTWSALGTGAGNGVSGRVNALAVSGSDLYVGGSFNRANEGGATVNVNYIARFDTTTNIWSALGTGGGNGVDYIVYALTAMGSDLYVGGGFSQANVGGAPVSASNVAKFDTTTGVWSALGGGVGGNVDLRAVFALAVSGSDLYVGGNFITAGGMAANRVAKYDTTTGAWSALGTGGGNGLNSLVWSLAVLGNDLYVGGSFTQANVGGTTVGARAVAKFDPTTNTWSALGSGGGNGVNGSVYALAVIGSDLYVGGGFNQANVGGPTVSVNRVAKVNTTSGAWSALGTGGGNGVEIYGVDPPVTALAVSGSDLYVGGSFKRANVGGTTVSANYVAKLNTTTGTWSALSSGVGNGLSYAVRAMAVLGNDIYVGGILFVAGTVAVNNIARFNTTTKTWSKLGSGTGNGVNSEVNALAVSGTDLYVGGAFFQANVGGTVVSVRNVAKFDTTTNTWSALGTGGGNGVDNFVNALAVIGNDLYVGMEFISQANVGGPTVSVNYIAKVNTTTGVWSALGTGGGNGVNSSVYALAVIGSDLYVGGFFTQANVGGTTVNANRVAKFDTTSSTWSALGTGGGNGLNSLVWSLAVLGNDLYVGGSFTQANGGGTTVGARAVAKFDPTTNTWSALGSGGGYGVAGAVFALAVSGNDLYAGGGLTQANVGGTTVSVNHVAKFDTTTNTWSALLDPGGGNGVYGDSNGVLADVRALTTHGGDLYVGGFFTTAGDNKASLNIARFCMCGAVLSQTSESFAANLSAETFTVQINAACSWTAVSNDPFITIDAPLGTVTGPGTVSYTVAANSGSSPRSGTISVAGRTFTVLQGVLFNDVPPEHPFYIFIGKLSARGITTGCGGGNFCPDANVTREQMAIFIERALGVFNPPPGPATPTFADVPNSGATDFSYEFIEDFALRGITQGCDAGPPRLYCPAANVTREQMAIFILRALEGESYAPPPGPATPTFEDVPNSGATDFSYEFIEEFVARGITQGCQVGPPRLYCPTAAVTRGQMAVFLVRAFNL